MQIVLPCISFTDFATKLEGYHNTCITSITELWTKTWNSFPCYCWKYLSISYEEDLRNSANTDTTNLTSALEKGRTIEETYPLKQNWLNAAECHDYSTCHERVAFQQLWVHLQVQNYSAPSGCIFSRAVPRAGQDGFHKWKNIHPSQASSCFFSRKFCSGNGFTRIWRGLKVGQCHGNLAGGWGEGIGWPPGDKTSHHISWILAHRMLSFLKYLCRSVMRGSSMCWVFLRVWLHLREMSSRKTKTLHDVFNESIPHKNPTRLTDY